jgi:hypothetical protein
MRKAGIGCLVLAGIGGIVVALVFYATGVLVEATDDFFSMIEQGDLSGAYALRTTSGFQKNVSLEQFKRLVRYTALGEVADSTWTSRNMSNNGGSLRGTITTERGVKIPAAIQLMKEQGEWRVHYIDMDALVEPTKEVQRELVSRYMTMVADAVSRKDFADVYAVCSETLRAGQTAEDFAKGFRGLLDSADELAKVKGREPVFDEDAQFDGFALALNGHYDIDEDKLHFAMILSFEELDWKLRQIDVALK